MGYDLNRITEAFVERVQSDKVRYHHGRGNRKLVGVMAFNVAPVITCAECTHSTCAAGKCYAIKNMLCHGYDIKRNNCLRSWIDNAIMAIYETETYFDDVRKDITKFQRYNDKRGRITYIRIHAAGDFYSDKVMRGWFDIAREFPDCKFLVYTKQYDMVTRNMDHIPDNVSIIVSQWPGLDIPDILQDRFPVAYLQSDNTRRVKLPRFTCPGSCERCKMCWYALAKQFDIMFIDH